MTRTLSYVPTAEVARVLASTAEPTQRAALLADVSRLNALYMIMRAGSGHLGSSYSAADLVSWLLLCELGDPFDADGDVYFSSKGHDAPGLYATMLALGALDENLVHRLRRLGGLPGHPDVHTPFMPFNTGSLGMGISKAKGMILADRLRNRRRRVFVLTGDGELQEGQNYEALGGAVTAQMDELTVIVDHNKFQSDTRVADVGDLGDLEARFAGFGWAVLRCDGHDLGAIRDTLAARRALEPGRPAVIIADTIKGQGSGVTASTSMAADEWRYLYHSGAPSNSDYERIHIDLTEAVDRRLAATGADPLRLESVEVADRAAPAANASLPQEYGVALVELARTDDRVIAFDADLVLDTGLIAFREEFPERFIECGIAEQDMVSMAGAMAGEGFVPFVQSFSCFLHSRPNEQIYNNATEGRKIIYAGSLAGVLPATPGHSHQSVREISAVGGVPGLTMIEPANAAQVRATVAYAIASPESAFVRLSSVAVPDLVSHLPVSALVRGRGEVVRVGSGDVVVMGAGPMVLEQLLRSSELLESRGDPTPTLVNLPWLNVVDAEWLEEIASTCSELVVVEHHYSRGGQADTVARAIAELESRRPRFRGIGLEEVPRCGTPEEVLTFHRLDHASLAESIHRPLITT